MGVAGSKICPCHQRDVAAETPVGKNAIPWRRKQGIIVKGGIKSAPHPIRAPRIGIISRQSGIDISPSNDDDDTNAKQKPNFFNHRPNRQTTSHHHQFHQQPMAKTRASNDARGNGDDDRKDEPVANDHDARGIMTTTTTPSQRLVAKDDVHMKLSEQAAFLSGGESADNDKNVSPSARRHLEATTTTSFNTHQHHHKRGEINSDHSPSERASVAQNGTQLGERKLSWGAQSDSGRCSVEQCEHANNIQANNGGPFEHTNNIHAANNVGPFDINSNNVTNITPGGTPITAWTTSKLSDYADETVRYDQRLIFAFLRMNFAHKSNPNLMNHVVLALANMRSI